MAYQLYYNGHLHTNPPLQNRKLTVFIYPKITSLSPRFNVFWSLYADLLPHPTKRLHGPIKSRSVQLADIFYKIYWVFVVSNELVLETEKYSYILHWYVLSKIFRKCPNLEAKYLKFVLFS